MDFFGEEPVSHFVDDQALTPELLIIDAVDLRNFVVTEQVVWILHEKCFVVVETVDVVRVFDFLVVLDFIYRVDCCSCCSNDFIASI